MDIVRRIRDLAWLGVLSATAVWAQSSPETASYHLGDVGEPVIENGEPVIENAAYVLPREAEECGGGYGECVGACGGWGCVGDTPWTLPQPCLLQRLGIKVGGWLEQGITFNKFESDDGFNGPVATNDWDDRYQVNQVWLFFDRPANTGGCGWALGGHVDMIYGTDWRFGINHGLEDRINGFEYQRYGLVIPQAYVEVGYDDLSVKLGHFAGILDFEAVPCIMNPFYSHSYCYGYTVPQLVTGVLGDYKVTERLSIQAGAHRGWLMFEDMNDNWDFMGGVKWSTCDKKTSIAYAVSTGPQDPFGDWNYIPGDQERFVYSLVFQHQVTERFKYVAVHNLGIENNALPGGQDAEWYGLNQYFLYTINPCWQANLRLEIMRDDDGARIAGPGNIPGVYAWNGRGFAGDFWGLTCGLSWRPHPNLLVRPELRWDWYSGLPGVYGPNNRPGYPFDGGNSDDQFTFGVDAVLTF